MSAIFENEPIRYTGARHWWNNGFRRRWLANGAENAAIINAARRGDFDAVLLHVRKMGGVSGGVGIARSLIKCAQKLADDVPGYKIVRDKDGIMVWTANVTWQFRNGRQIGVIGWTPMFGLRFR